MQTLYLYKNGIPRNIKIDNRDNILQYLNSQNPITIELEGCYITNTNNYVDVSFYDVLWDTICEYSYVRVGAKGNDIFAHIDRIEPNNFNKYEDGLENSFRIYFTVDWFTTLICRDYATDNYVEVLYDNIEGNVERAHINDCVPVVGGFLPMLDNTLVECECHIERYNKKSYKIGEDFYFLYILSSNGPTDANCVFTIEDNIETQYSPPLNVYIGAIRPTNGYVNVIYNYEGVPNTTEDVSIAYYSAIISDENQITDSSVYSMWITNLCPIYSREENAIKMYSYNNSYEGKTSSELERVNDFSSFGKTPNGDDHTVRAYQTIGKINSSSYTNSNILTGSTVFSKPTSYNEYLESIPKQYYAPYCISTIEAGEGSIVLDTIKINTPVLFTYNISVEDGAMVGVLSQTTLQGPSKKFAIPTGGIFTRIGTDDEFTRNTRIAYALKSVGQQIQYSGDIAKNVALKDYPTAVAKSFGSVGDIVSSYTNLKKMIRDGETGYKAMPDALEQLFNEPKVVVRNPITMDIDKLRKDLALYGYNTHLHPHQILSGNSNKRKHFNYIKLNNANITATFLTTEQKLQLEEMFNNGVWLWHNAETFGNFEVNNYPIILDN